MHPVYILAFVTFAAILGFLAWNVASVRRHQKTGGGNTSGIGGKADPMSGTTSGMRDPEEMRRAMDAAAARRREPQPVGGVR